MSGFASLKLTAKTQVWASNLGNLSECNVWEHSELIMYQQVASIFRDYISRTHSRVVKQLQLAGWILQLTATTEDMT